MTAVDAPGGLMTDTPFSFSFFSCMGGGSTIAPHFGPVNLRLRCHFPLIVPAAATTPITTTTTTTVASTTTATIGMQVGSEVVQWEAGKALVFDDTFEHRVWNHTSLDRVILLFDVWHPDLYPEEIAAVKEMFSYARQQGWLAAAADGNKAKKKEEGGGNAKIN